MGKFNNDERFKYVNYRHTDTAKTFARIRRQQAEEAKAKEEAKANVLPIQRKERK